MSSALRRALVEMAEPRHRNYVIGEMDEQCANNSTCIPVWRNTKKACVFVAAVTDARGITSAGLRCIRTNDVVGGGFALTLSTVSSAKAAPLAEG